MFVSYSEVFLLVKARWIMVPLDVPTFSAKQMPLLSAVHFTAAVPISTTSANFFRLTGYQKEARFCHPVGCRVVTGRIFAVDKGRVSLPNQKGFWEDPSYGSDGEDSDEESDENDLDFESHWETERDAPNSTNFLESPSRSSHEEDLAKEVEQLLEPKERAILQQNQTPNLDNISTEKWSSLHTCAIAGQIKFVDRLLESGVDIDLIDKDGLTALHRTIIGKREAVISHLLRKGASPHIRDLDGASSLHYAVQVGAMQTVKLLIKYNVDVNVADYEGWTPLHVAVQTRNRYIVKLLLVNGADKTRRTKDGKTPLDLSLCYGKDFKSYDLARLLKRVPADTDI